MLLYSIFLFKLKIGNYRILILGLVLYRKIQLFTGQMILNLATCYAIVLSGSDEFSTQIVARRLLITLNHFIKLIVLVLNSSAVFVSDQWLPQRQKSPGAVWIANISDV